VVRHVDGGLFIHRAYPPIRRTNEFGEGSSWESYSRTVTLLLPLPMSLLVVHPRVTRGNVRDGQPRTIELQEMEPLHVVVGQVTNDEWPTVHASRR
jgi:hypothetical protein